MIAPLLLGFGFGWVLHKARLGRYATIVGVFRLRDLTVLQFMASGMIVAMIGVQALAFLGLARALPVPHGGLVAAGAGGLIFGAGMALAGFCPATVAAGAGEGRLDHLIAGGLGLYTGAVVLGWIYPDVVPALARQADVGATTLARLLGVSPWLVIVIVVELAALGGWALTAARRRARAADRTT
jgi:hypothetical protein